MRSIGITEPVPTPGMLYVLVRRLQMRCQDGSLTEPVEPLDDLRTRLKQRSYKR